MRFNIICGDILEKLSELENNTFDGIFCDPPYGINFMNKKWDHGVPSAEVWKEILRVCKPGAWLLSFGGTRTHHRLMVNIEDAGWEIRDCCMYLYGSGFPKSYNISKGIDNQVGKERVKGELRSNGRGKWDIKMDREKGDTGVGHADGSKQVYYETLPNSDEAIQWDGYGTALKPAWEPIILARKPVEKNNANNCMKWGCGGLNIDGCRVDSGPDHAQNCNRTSVKGHWGNSGGAIVTASDQGRFPANLILEDNEEVLDLFPSAKGQQGDLKNHNKKRKSPNGCFGEMGAAVDHNKRNDTGSAARFFYTAKVSPKERNAGLENEKNIHPTLKPVSLCEYLAKLILPPTDDSNLLVPFSGTGSEIAGALKAGWKNVTGIELEDDYCKIAEKRIPALKEM